MKQFLLLRSACFTLLLLFSFTLSFSQSSIPITGKITGAGGEALPGVTVQVKGTETKTLTAADGTFRIEVPSVKSVLVFSYVGYAELEQAVNDSRQLNLSLTQQTNTLQDVVVVGYGTRRRSDVTGAISSVTSEDIKQVPTANISQALQGRVAGLVATQNSFRPGSGSTIRIRGTRSLTARINPLFVVDGIPLDLDNTIDDINPLDIESIDVLKDASATAIYGSRGANGVIQIT